MTKTGAGSGAVTSSPAGIDCGSTCAFNFNAGLTITLTAQANPGSVFLGWGQVPVPGGSYCSSTASSCTVLMNGDYSVSADFALVQTTTTTTTTTTAATTITPSPSGTVLFNGDFNTCNLSQWSDLHDAMLGSSPPGFVIRSTPAFASCSSQVNVTNAAGTSSSGDASFLWAGGNYDLPWLAKGADTWFRMQVAFPDGTNAAFPGKFVHSVISSGWDTFMEWHSAPSAGYSTTVGVWGSDPPRLMLRPVGGAMPNQTSAWIWDSVGLQYNHWYDIVVHQVFSDDPNVGYIEWWVDGVQKYAAHLATLTRRTDGSVPAVSFQTGLYRGPSRSDIDTIYIDGVKAGTTRASIGG